MHGQKNTLTLILGEFPINKQLADLFKRFEKMNCGFVIAKSCPDLESKKYDNVTILICTEKVYKKSKTCIKKFVKKQEEKFKKFQVLTINEIEP